jgi:hypothetical protein
MSRASSSTSGSGMLSTRIDDFVMVASTEKTPSVPYGHGLANPDMHPQPDMPPSEINDPPSALAYPSLVASKLYLSQTVRATACTLNGDQLEVSGAPASQANVSGPDKNCADTSAGRGKSVEKAELNVANLAQNPPLLLTIQAGADDIDFGDCLSNELLRPLPIGHACKTGGKVTPVNGNPIPRGRSTEADDSKPNFRTLNRRSPRSSPPLSEPRPTHRFDQLLPADSVAKLLRFK